MNDRSVKSFWISFATPRLVLGLLLALALTAPALAARGKQPSIEDLTNFLLGPDYSQWLVGAIAELATEEEVNTYLGLNSDEEAVEFIEAFWRGRDDPAKPWPQEQTQGTFERRALEADKLYTEGTTLGRRTDRGETYILFGAPERVEYTQVAPPRRGNVEIWVYPRDAEPGLTRKKPRSEYYFLKRDGLTIAYSPSVRDRRARPGRGGL